MSESDLAQELQSSEVNRIRLEGVIEGMQYVLGHLERVAHPATPDIVYSVEQPD